MPLVSRQKLRNGGSQKSIQGALVLFGTGGPGNPIIQPRFHPLSIFRTAAQEIWTDRCLRIHRQAHRLRRGHDRLFFFPKQVPHNHRCDNRHRYEAHPQGTAVLPSEPHRFHNMDITDLFHHFRPAFFLHSITPSCFRFCFRHLPMRYRCTGTWFSVIPSCSPSLEQI